MKTFITVVLTLIGVVVCAQAYTSNLTEDVPFVSGWCGAALPLLAMVLAYCAGAVSRDGKE